MSLLQKQRVHCVGIGGIGLSALAKILANRGMQISGSDAEDSLVVTELKNRGWKIFIGHSAANILENVEAIIFSSAVPENNPERVAARERGIPEFSYSQALGELTAGYRTIAVSGTHGKSTTTAMIGSVLIDAGYDPTVLVGTRVAKFSDQNSHLGKSEWLVVEACEHEAQMMNLHPEFIVLTNLEPDHLDFYGSFANIKKTFSEYVKKVAPEKCVANADDVDVMELFSAGEKPATYGLHAGELLPSAELKLQIPGAFNIANALAATRVCELIGIPRAVSYAALAKYPGSWRRFERVGEFQGLPVVSDYGHHPTAIRETLKATQEFFPNKKILLVYQPHQHHRTKALFNDFVAPLQAADALVLVEIYDVKGRVEAHDRDVTSARLLEKINIDNSLRPRVYAADENAAAAATAKIIAAGGADVILIMGAGDVYHLANRLCSKF